jgi:DNA adenine methylase
LAQEYQQIPSHTPKPFLKWAGGKRQLIPILENQLPQTFDVYYEPFLGGGAFLFHILSKNPNQKCRVSDLNSDLVLAYVTIRDKVDHVISELKLHEKNYMKSSKSYYYSIRDESPKTDVDKTARLIFLNRTCFNGLYRVNSHGKFNVPLGKYTNPSIVNEENLRAVSSILNSKNIEIKCQDFTSILTKSKANDFVYFDPPYQPVSQTSNFTSYTNKDFRENDLKRLSILCNDLDEKGTKVLLSNSDSSVVKKQFKKSWKIITIDANRAINSNSKRRTGHTELLIKNY